MAQQGRQLDHEKFSCPICLDLLEDPATLPCGHSYCVSCIRKHWDEEDPGGIPSCPQCRQTFIPKPVLRKNTMLADLVEELKKTGLPAAPHPQHYAGPGDVACDMCSGRKLKASRSCLQCVASYCELHLQPHYESPAFQKHKLVEASAKLQENICSVHSKVKEVFCRSDQQCIYYLCAMDEHRGHDTVSAAAERTERQRELQPRRLNIQQRIRDTQKEVELLQQQVEAINDSADKALRDSQAMFSQLLRLVEKRSSEVQRQIRSQQQTEVSRAKELQKKLQQEMSELRRRDAELEQLSRTEEHSQFLLTYSSLSALSESTHSASINVCPHGCFREVTAAVSELTEKLQSLLSQDHTRISATGGQASLRPKEIKRMAEHVDEEKMKEVLPELESVLSPICFQYAEDLLKKNSVTQNELLNICSLLVDKVRNKTKDIREVKSGFVWRKALGDPWRKVCWGNNQRDLHYVQEYKPEIKNIRHLRVLFYGPVGAGRTSFINSVSSVLQGRITAWTWTSDESFNTRYKTHKLIKGRGSSATFHPVVFTDMGLQRETNCGVHPDDIKLAMKGHVMEGYKFNPVASLSAGDPGYNLTPSADDKVHVLVCVHSANAKIDNSVLEKMHSVRQAASDLGIPQMAVITKIDEACPEIEKDLKNVYKSKHMKQKIVEFSSMMAIPMNRICPVKNYSNELNMNENVDTLILSALKKVIEFGDVQV